MVLGAMEGGCASWEGFIIEQVCVILARFLLTSAYSSPMF
jgi:hypothetical protein